MITIKELYHIGYVAKTHGIKGELNIALDTEFNPEDFKFLVFEVDGIYVPFPIISVRGQNDSYRLVSIEGVENDGEARVFVGKTAYVLIRELKDGHQLGEDESNGIYLSDLIGYNLVDENDTVLGEIIGFNDDTANWLLEIKLPDGSTQFIPYVEDWVTEFNPDRKTFGVNLPNGLLTL